MPAAIIFIAACARIYWAGSLFDHQNSVAGRFIHLLLTLKAKTRGGL
jgi:hypothetical protein